MESEVGAGAALGLVEVPVPGGLEVWFVDLLARWEAARRSRRPVPKPIQSSCLCWNCRTGLIAQGKSQSQFYARKNKLCRRCYIDGARLKKGREYHV
jgi:hypothetical protein